MLNNKIKSIVSICVIGSMFLTGCSTSSLEDRVNNNELNNLGSINVPETQQQTTNKEETKAEPKEGTITQGTGEARLCHDCGLEIEAGNNTNLCDHCLFYGNCSDCGKERLKEDMTFKGTKYHCGCADQTFNCAYCGKTTTLDNCVGASYCSNECLDASMMISCAECGKSVDPFETAEYNEHEYCYECYNSIMNATFGGPASVPEE